MSNKLDQVSEQLAQSKAESDHLMRQNASDQQELAMLRRNLLVGGGGGPILHKMYETMLGRYEDLKTHHDGLQQTLTQEAKSRKETQNQLDAYVAELSDARMRCNNIVSDHELLSRKFQSLNEKNDMLQRDLHRVREERTLVKREYALVMSERDAVHKEIQKLTDDISDVNRQLAESVNEKKLILDDKERLLAQLNTLKQNQGTQQTTSATSQLALREELFVAQRERKQALGQYEAQLHEAYTARKAQELANDTIVKLRAENEALSAKIEALNGELRDANNEARDATRNRDMAFGEREKMRCERDEIKKTYDQLAEERERIMKQLEAEIKEHDITKELKKNVSKELRELKPRRVGIRGSTTGSKRDNTDSHDSAIDAGEWGSEEISTLEGGGMSRRLRTFQYQLPRQPDINLDTGLFVTRSACRGITIGDRVVSINETSVDAGNASQLQRLIPNSANPCKIKVMRSSSPLPLTSDSQGSRNNNLSLNGDYSRPNESQSSRDHTHENSLNGDYGPSSVDSAVFASRPNAESGVFAQQQNNDSALFAEQPNADSTVYTSRQNILNKQISTADAECQTSQTLRMKSRKSLSNPVEDFWSTEDTITPMRNAQHANTPSNCMSSGGESHQSASTYSESNHSAQASILPRQLSQKSSDSNVSVQRSSSAKREKKKPKASRIWSKIKKPKNQNSTSNKSSSGGTWPRLESPPITPFGGRLSVFTKKKPRPTLSPTTFTPPPSGMDNAGRTPPTVARGSAVQPNPTDNTPRLFEDIQPGTLFNIASRNLNKRPRPVSVPIDSGQPLTLWKEQNVSNNNNSLSPRRPNTPRNPLLPETFHESGTIASEPSPDSSSISTNQSERLKLFNQSGTENQFNVTTVQPTVTRHPRPHTFFSERPPGFIRQQSVPPTPTTEQVLALSEVISPRQPFSRVQRSRVVTSPTNNLQPRSVRSLPRPTSARPATSRTSSHQSIETHHQYRTKSVDYKRIRIPSQTSIGMKLSGSEKGSINLSDRSTPNIFNHRSHSPATPLLHSPATPLLRSQPSSLQYAATPPPHPITMTSFSSLATPTFHPSSTPLIPSPATPLPPASSLLMDSPVPPFPGSTVSSLSSISGASARGRRPPVTTDPRLVRMTKGTDPIGISIVGGGEKGGIFVSRITEDSLAARAGLEYGDQLLEYNGINLRCANEELGRVIMSQSQPGDNIEFLAQYNLEKYKSSIESNLSDSLGFMKVTKQPRNSALTPCEDNEGTMTPGTTPRSSPYVEESIRAQPIGQPRYIFVTGNCGHVTLVGGNRSGIFIAAVGDGENTNDLKIGDQLLEYNSTGLRSSTLERASLLISKPTVNSSLSVYYNSVGFSKLSLEPGDFFYVRALFDNNAVEPPSGNLHFTRNSILLVDDTYLDHTMGSWSAWLVDEHGEKTVHGKIPSKFMVERESSGLHRDFDDSASCAGSTAGKKLGGTGRRSFFKRRKPHRHSSRSSGDIKLHKSVSETSIESTETSFEHSGAAYQVVTKHVCEHRRPVVVFGPHANTVCERLVKEYGNSFAKCALDSLPCNVDIHDKELIDTFKQNTVALRVDTLIQEMQQHRHVLLEISQDAVDRLHSHKIYPIIVFIEYNNAKKIKESQDRFPGREKISMKQSKEIFERANSIRKKLSTKYLGTVYIHGGSSNTVAKQIHTVVDREQSKVLWLPASHDLLNY
ncbi:uncharacterized protein LOC120346979 isoform X2 [Styela clava]